MPGGSRRIMPLKKCETKRATETTIIIDSDSDEESEVYTVKSPNNPSRNSFSTYLQRKNTTTIAEISNSSGSDCEITAREEWERASSSSVPWKGKKSSAWCNECISDMPDVMNCLSMIYKKYCGDDDDDDDDDDRRDLGVGGGGDAVVDREKHKETAEFRRAEEAEWESRTLLLKMQAEEAQRQKKRKKAENLRKVEMEKRQKQRLEEIRQSQKKVEELVHLKEKIRAEVRKEFEAMERRYSTMASVLRELGVVVEGGSCPLLHQVNAAYKQALRKFHPDRFSTGDVRQQVKAEETFKFITRLKDKWLPNM